MHLISTRRRHFRQLNDDSGEAVAATNSVVATTPNGAQCTSVGCWPPISFFSFFFFVHSFCVVAFSSDFDDGFYVVIACRVSNSWIISILVTTKLTIM